MKIYHIRKIKIVWQDFRYCNVSDTQVTICIRKSCFIWLSINCLTGSLCCEKGEYWLFDIFVSNANELNIFTVLLQRACQCYPSAARKVSHCFTQELFWCSWMGGLHHEAPVMTSTADGCQCIDRPKPTISKKQFGRGCHITINIIQVLK